MEDPRADGACDPRLAKTLEFVSNLVHDRGGHPPPRASGNLYTWDRALRAGTLIPGALLHEMFTPQVAMGGPDDAHYGFGWVISRAFGRKMISHAGGIQGFTSLNSWCPDDDAYVIVLDNVSSPEVGAIGKSLAAILFGQKYELPRERKAIAVKPDELQKYVGQYELTPKLILSVRREGDQLVTEATGQVEVPIYPESKDAFFAKVIDAQISFTENSAGEVTGLVLHQGGARHAGQQDPLRRARVTMAA